MFADGGAGDESDATEGALTFKGGGVDAHSQVGWERQCDPV
jgi:hypothetical protein